jgi:hypothetical protein
MNKVGIALALFVAAASGMMVYKTAGNTASAESEAARIAASARKLRMTGAGAPIVEALAAHLQPVQPGLANPFPALATIATTQTAPGQSVLNQAALNQEGFADLNPLNRSGIRALISVKRTEQSETITGFATNMDPSKAYISLFYDAGSPGAGPCACIPSNPPPAMLQSTCKTTEAPAVNFSQMVVGYWLPLTGSSTRTLQVLKNGAPDAPAPQAFVPLENIGAISVREDTQVGKPLPSESDPARFQLRACGRFRIDMD